MTFSLVDLIQMPSPMCLLFSLNIYCCFCCCCFYFVLFCFAFFHIEHRDFSQVDYVFIRKGEVLCIFLWYALEITENMIFLLKITLSILWRFIQNIKWSIICVRLKSLEGKKQCSFWRPEVTPFRWKEEGFFCYYYEYTQETECHIKRTSVIITYMMEECNDSLAKTR